MARPLKILFISTEVEPFAKTGGLADVSSALPRAVKALGHDVRTVMPRYGEVDAARWGLREEPGTTVRIPLDGTLASGRLLSLPGGEVPVYFLENPLLYGREGIYTDPEGNRDFPDNHLRFIFFCRAVLEAVKFLDWKPDLLHCNDWPTALVPAYLRTLHRSDPFFEGTRTLFTIHNMAYQGVFPRGHFPATGLPADLMSEAGLEAYGSMNFLKAGLMFADLLTTVSPTYAREIQSSPELGCGLEGLLQRRSTHLHGILNGADYGIWNPSTDSLIPRRYDISTVAEGKTANKRALLAAMDLPFSGETPVIGMISRLVDQKGFDLLGPALDGIAAAGAQLVLLGTGDPAYEKMLRAAAERLPGKVGVRIGFDTPLAHLVEAGSDMFLMPSRYEPCGLNQMYSLRYGTVPVVRATGGLEDTVEDADEGGSAPTGFKFSRYAAEDLLGAVRRAVELWRRPRDWARIRANGMAADFSWARSAGAYERLYRSLLPA
ncbi:MAG: glycogen synthase GlgA [Bacteroidota bacterium]